MSEIIIYEQLNARHVIHQLTDLGMSHLRGSWVNYQVTWLLQILRQQDMVCMCINIDHFYGVSHKVSPVQVAMDPVHCKTTCQGEVRDELTWLGICCGVNIKEPDLATSQVRACHI